MKADFTIFFLLVLAVAAFVGSDSLSTPVYIAAIPGLVLVQLYRETGRGAASGGMDQKKQPVEKLGLQAVQKGPDARRAFIVIVYVKRDLGIQTSTNTNHEHVIERGDRSATKQVGLFQQPVKY